MFAKRKTAILLAAVVIILAWVVCRQRPEKHPETNSVTISDFFRPRTIVTTDGECDDLNSFVHLLLCVHHAIKAMFQTKRLRTPVTPSSGVAVNTLEFL